jgi:hypothetical protein
LIQAPTVKVGVETFIVRIYRRASDSADGPAGTVECVGCGERLGFVGRDELWARLFLREAHAHERQPPDDATGKERTSGLVGTRDKRRNGYGEDRGE